MCQQNKTNTWKTRILYQNTQVSHCACYIGGRGLTTLLESHILDTCVLCVCAFQQSAISSYHLDSTNKNPGHKDSPTGQLFF